LISKQVQTDIWE